MRTCAAEHAAADLHRAEVAGGENRAAVCQRAAAECAADGDGTAVVVTVVGAAVDVHEGAHDVGLHGERAELALDVALDRGARGGLRGKAEPAERLHRETRDG